MKYEDFWMALASLSEEECDNTHSITKGICNLKGLPEEAVLEFCRQNGGCCCDCEILMNMSPDEKPHLNHIWEELLNE
jgi:hypothetical protein